MLLVALFLADCNKLELPPDEEPGTPVFFADFSISSGQTYRLEAGKSDYYQFTDIQQDESGVYEFIGRLEELDCLDFCGPALSIRFRDIEQMGTPDNADSVLDPDRDFPLEGTPTIIADTQFYYQINLMAEPIDFFGAVYNWTFDGQVLLTMEENLQLQVDSVGPYDVCLGILQNQVSFCSSEQCKTLFNTGGQSCGVYIGVDSVGPVAMELQAIAEGGVPPYTYSWGQGSNSPTIQVFNPGDYEVTLTDATGCQSEARIFINQNPTSPNCSARFSQNVATILEIDQMEIEDSLDLGVVILEFQDVSGVVYSSAHVAQSAEAFFQVLEVAPYENNEQGRPTLRYRAVFGNVRVVSETGVVLEIGEGSVWMAVARAS